MKKSKVINMLNFKFTLVLVNLGAMWFIGAMTIAYLNTRISTVSDITKILISHECYELNDGDKSEKDLKKEIENLKTKQKFLLNEIGALKDKKENPERYYPIIDPGISDIARRIRERKKLKVLVTAYNSVPEQCDDDPFIAAWGDELKEGMRIIAVSRDLEKEYGLTRGVLVEIKGYGKYKVLDRMHYRKKKQVDIYMGTDIKSAKEFGVKKLQLTILDEKEV